MVCQAEDVRKEEVFMPCSHMATCERCSEQLAECPMCRARIQQRLKVNMA